MGEGGESARVFSFERSFLHVHDVLEPNFGPMLGN